MSRRGLGTARMVVALLCAAIVGMLVPVGASASTLPAGFEETTVLPAAAARSRRTSRSRPTGVCSWPRSPESSGRSTVSTTRRRRCSPTCARRCTTTAPVGCCRSWWTRASRRSRTCTCTTRWTLRSAARRRCTVAPRRSTRARRPTGGLDENCSVGSRISRLTVSGEIMIGASSCWSRTTASSTLLTPAGGLAFGADGNLYASASDGSTSQFWDYGQTGTPSQPVQRPGGLEPHASDVGGRPPARSGPAHLR